MVGLNIITFWDLTPLEFSLIVKAYVKHKKEHQEERLILTYLGAYWNRAKQMPNIKSILDKQPEKKEMTAEEMLENVKKLNTILGGKMS